MKLSISRFGLVLLLTLLSYLSATPRLMRTGTNIVTQTYHTGAARFMQGTDLYRLPLERGDRFEYSPFFAQLYSGLARLSDRAEANVWAFLNCFLFWIGVLVWLPRDRHRSGALIAAILVCSMELNISVLYQQINAALCGLILLAGYWYRTNRRFTSGFLLAVITNIKIFPGVFLAALIPRGGPGYLWGAVLGTVTVLCFPALHAGFLKNAWMHQQWLVLLTDTLVSVRRAQLDIRSVLSGFGFPTFGTIAYFGVFGVTASLAALLPFIDRTERAKVFKHWLMVTMMGILLFSPLTESPTFILAAPGYIYLTELLVAESHRNRGVAWAGVTVLVMAAVLMTVSYTDLWPKFWWRPTYPYKTLGLFTLWLMETGYVGFVVTRALMSSRSPSLALPVREPI